MSLGELFRHLNKVVELEFEDGHIVRALLVSIDQDEPPEIIYDVHEVVAVGPREFAGIRPGVVAAADPSELISVRAEPTG